MSISSPVPEGQQFVPHPARASAARSLDVLRGIALLGLLFTSIWIFGGFSQNQQNGLLIPSKGLNYRLFGTVNLLLEGKMLALLSIVFGAGMVIYLFKDFNNGIMQKADFFIRRQMWLIAFGLINGLLFLWTRDLLFHLGIFGILLFPFVRISARSLLIIAFLFTLIYTGKNYWRYADDKKVYNKYLLVLAAEKKIAKDSIARNTLRSKTPATSKALKKDTLTKKQVQEKQAWEGLAKGKLYDPKRDDEKIKTIRDNSYTKVWDHLYEEVESREAQWSYTEGLWEIGSMLLLGMALLKFGFFNVDFSKNKYLLFAVGGITAGILLGWFRLNFLQISLQDYTSYIVSHWFPHHLLFPFEIACMAVGYASLILYLIRTGVLRKVWLAFGLTGEMALSNYFLQTLICAGFFYGFGLGYYARLQQWQLYVFAAEVVLVNIVFSVAWLRFYYYGPAEWLWRCLIYKTWFPNKRDNYYRQQANPIA